MKLLRAILPAIIALTPLLAHAEESCPAGFPSDFISKEGDAIAAPSGFTNKKAIAQFLDGSAPVGNPVPAGAVAIDDKDVIQALKNGKTLRLQFRAGTSAATCTVNVKANPSAPATAPSPASANDAMACETAAGAYGHTIGATTTRPFALVVFCGAGSALHFSSRPNDVVVVGDPIYVGVYTDSSQTSINIEWPNCTTRDATPKRFGSTNFNTLPTLTGLSGNAMFPVTPSMHRECFNTSVDIKVTSQSSSNSIPSLNRTETVQQYELYNYSLQLGAVFTDVVSHNYAVAADATGTTHIQDNGPTGKGPEYFAALTVYGLPWQICSAFNGCKSHSPYLGRDLVHDQGFLDRVSAVLGVGLSHPSDEFIAGLGFEVLPGINALAGYRRAKIDVLNGVSAGDKFTGAAGDIPKKSQWEGSFVLGFAVDLNYVTNWFGRK